MVRIEREISRDRVIFDPLIFPSEVFSPEVFVVTIEAHRGEMGVLVIVLCLSALEISCIYV